MALPTRHTQLNEIADIDTFYNGGEGSGNFGHQGRPGKVGGSGNGQGVKVTDKKSAMDEIRRVGEIERKLLIKKSDLEDKITWGDFSEKRKQKLKEEWKEVKKELKKAEKKSTEVREKYEKEYDIGTQDWAWYHEGITEAEYFERQQKLEKEWAEEKKGRQEAMKKWGKGEKLSKDESRRVLDSLADDVMGGDLEDYDESFEGLIEPVMEGKLTKAQLKGILLDGKPAFTKDKKEIYWAARFRLQHTYTSPEESAEDMKYARGEWKEDLENY